ncbi:Zinc finger BED domain-containing protein 4 [Dufourea novaeangliae]|uniref:Zinc finger BED domain-containing protein 4 n=1 Tax=Dufourea novaeangliae TaxID=178035 RepID=A0A154PK43_DUFNO|nr:Zinc finger BED domain-containing protein 4 [Dufourea novaeangliae]
MWTSNNTDGFLTVTCHFISNEFVLKSCTLETEKVTGSHTGIYLSSLLNRIFHDWGIESKVRCVVTDNTPSMLSAVRSLGSGVTSIPCFAQTLNLVVKKSLNAIAELVTIRQKCRNIVSYFKSSCLATEKLTEIQNRFGIENHKLILEDETRWNSTYEMFSRLIEQQRAVSAAMSTVSIERLTTSDWDMMASCLSVLGPFALFTAELSSEAHVSISKVFPGVQQMYRCLNVHEHVLASKLREMMDKYFHDIVNNSIYCMCSMLDPRFKQLGFMPTETVEILKKLIIGIITVPTESDNNSLSTDDESISSFWSDFKTMVSAHNCCNTDELSEVAELDNYLKERIEVLESDPVEYWKINAIRYPKLSKLAQKLLCCPATSVPSERIFSKAGNIVSKKRNRLKDSTVNKMLFLNSL